MTLTQFDYCEQCDDRVELVPVAGGDALACCRCGSINGGELL
jgi:uncharacterized paraquat-inducible protein A